MRCGSLTIHNLAFRAQCSLRSTSPNIKISIRFFFIFFGRCGIYAVVVILIYIYIRIEFVDVEFLANFVCGFNVTFDKDQFSFYVLFVVTDCIVFVHIKYYHSHSVHAKKK